VRRVEAQGEKQEVGSDSRLCQRELLQSALTHRWRAGTRGGRCNACR
jgi:hypothetical protein